MKPQSIIRVALTDDHTILRSGLRLIISKWKEFEVIIEAANGRELIEQLDRAESLPHICLLDIDMPVMNGYDTLAVLSKKWPDIHVLILSMYDNEYSIISMLQNGARGYLLKNVSPDELHEALKTIHSFGFYSSEIMSKDWLGNERSREKTYPKISPREMEFLSLSCSELSYKEISERMGLSQRTVESYRDILFGKLGVNSRIGLALFALQAGIVSINSRI